MEPCRVQSVSVTRGGLFGGYPRDAPEIRPLLRVSVGSSSLVLLAMPLDVGRPLASSIPPLQVGVAARPQS